MEGGRGIGGTEIWTFCDGVGDLVRSRRGGGEGERLSSIFMGAVIRRFEAG
jgi:hypothetical protein